MLYIDKDSIACYQVMSRFLKLLPSSVRRTLTVDQGKEGTHYLKLAKDMKTKEDTDWSSAAQVLERNVALEG